ncbi:MAG: hypothetical protein H7Y32_03825 [Chloroflexales bacterium]|nr:hypothetical protein [Chloroflexales bacterium]
MSIKQLADDFARYLYLPRRQRSAVLLAAIEEGVAQLVSNTGQIVDAVVQHLSALVGAKVRITIDIQADMPEGASEQVVRTVTENCRTLHFDSAGFEEH